jgi:signal transduction histidine kinase
MDDNGAGLGLSIARLIAEVHKGRLELQRSDSTGSIFSVSLPRSPSSTVATFNRCVR